MKNLFILLSILLMPSAVLAVPVTFFGEDASTAGVALGPNAAAARADFLSNLSGVGNEGFESFALGQTAPLNLSFPGSTGVLGATISGAGSIDDSGPGRFATSGSKFWATSTGSFVIDFADPVSAFGFNGIDIGDFVTDKMTLDLVDIGGGTQTLTVDHSLNIGNTANATLFFGFYDTGNSYSSIEFFNVGGSDTFAFDDMVIGDVRQIVPSVSEPGTFAIFSMGVVGLFFARRKKSILYPCCKYRRFWLSYRL